MLSIISFICFMCLCSCKYSDLTQSINSISLKTGCVKYLLLSIDGSSIVFNSSSSFFLERFSFSTISWRSISSSVGLAMSGAFHFLLLSSRNSTGLFSRSESSSPFNPFFIATTYNSSVLNRCWHTWPILQLFESSCCLIDLHSIRQEFRVIGLESLLNCA